MLYSGLSERIVSRSVYELTICAFAKPFLEAASNLNIRMLFAPCEELALSNDLYSFYRNDVFICYFHSKHI